MSDDELRLWPGARTFFGILDQRIGIVKKGGVDVATGSGKRSQKYPEIVADVRQVGDCGVHLMILPDLVLG